jgi:transposase
LKTDFGGLPIAFHLTGGEASDGRNFETLLDIGPDINPRAALGDKGYDSKSNRDAARRRGICPAIPYRSNTKDVPAFFPKRLYKGRARIEQTVGKLKRFKRIALRCEKTARKLRVARRARLRFHLDQIRPHDLGPSEKCGDQVSRPDRQEHEDDRRVDHWSSLKPEETWAYPASIRHCDEKKHASDRERDRANYNVATHVSLRASHLLYHYSDDSFYRDHWCGYLVRTQWAALVREA